MSAPPSPHLSQVPLDQARVKKRDRPPALDIDVLEQKAASDGDVRYGAAAKQQAQQVRDPRHITFVSFPLIPSSSQPRLYVSSADESMTEHDHDAPRSTSATSSLDPYYFSVPSESPIPPLPDLSMIPDSATTSRTPELPTPSVPITPARDPAAIDRRGLVGVGDLMTPRWSRSHRSSYVEDSQRMDHVGEEEEDDGQDIEIRDDNEQRDSDSPWTIEAIDGEPEESTDVRRLPILVYLLNSTPF